MTPREPSHPDPLRPAAASALESWAARVRANREQVERFREVPDGDFYAPVAPAYRFDPERADDALLAVLAGLLRADDVLLDIGCGGGRYALPLAAHVRRVIALDPSPAMRAVLAAGVAAREVRNIEVLAARWPVRGTPPSCDVALIVNVGYDVEEIGPFLDAMERSARRLCIAVFRELPPPHDVDSLWPAVHGEARAALPALPELLALQLARGRLSEVRLLARAERPTDPVERAARARRLLWLREGSPKDLRLASLLAGAPAPVAPRVGVVSWAT